MTTTSTDQIRKRVVLNAPHERVWRAISEAEQFSRWFGITFNGSFVAGQPLVGRLHSANHKYDGLAFDFHVERIDPMSVFSFRWHPYAVERDVDYSSEPMTLVEFALEPVAGGTQLTVTESGFDRIPLARRAAAFAANDGGWEEQVQRIEKYVTLPAA